MRYMVTVEDGHGQTREMATIYANGRTRAYWMALGHAITDGYGPFARIVVKEM